VTLVTFEVLKRNLRVPQSRCLINSKSRKELVLNSVLGAVLGVLFRESLCYFSI
jgi:hypothetical protein